MEQYFDLLSKSSLMQEDERWKQKTEDHEMNFKASTESMAAVNCEFFPNVKYMLKTPIPVAHAAMNVPSLLWDASRLGWWTQPRKTDSMAWFTTCKPKPWYEPKHYQVVWCIRPQENCDVMFLYCMCLELGSVQYFANFSIVNC